MPAWAAEPCQFGCQTLPYRAHPVDWALEGIRKAGYGMLHSTHQGQSAFSPSLSSSARADLRCQMRDAGLAACISFVGLTADLRTVLGVGPWYYTRVPTVPKRARDWDKECDDHYAALERAVPHAESVGVTITLKPHTGLTATAKACLEVVKLGAGLRGPLAVERADGKEDAFKIPPEVIDQRIAAVRNFPVPLLEEHSRI